MAFDSVNFVYVRMKMTLILQNISLPVIFLHMMAFLYHMQIKTTAYLFRTILAARMNLNAFWDHELLRTSFWSLNTSSYLKMEFLLPNAKQAVKNICCTHISVFKSPYFTIFNLPQFINTNKIICTIFCFCVKILTYEGK